MPILPYRRRSLTGRPRFIELALRLQRTSVGKRTRFVVVRTLKELLSLLLGICVYFRYLRCWSQRAPNSSLLNRDNNCRYVCVCRQRLKLSIVNILIDAHNYVYIDHYVTCRHKVYSTLKWIFFLMLTIKSD